MIHKLVHRQWISNYGMRQSHQASSENQISGSQSPNFWLRIPQGETKPPPLLLFSIWCCSLSTEALCGPLLWSQVPPSQPTGIHLPQGLSDALRLAPDGLKVKTVLPHQCAHLCRQVRRINCSSFPLVSGKKFSHFINSVTWRLLSDILLCWSLKRTPKA